MIMGQSGDEVWHFIECNWCNIKCPVWLREIVYNLQKIYELDKLFK